jgi:hypothetical protein
MTAFRTFFDSTAGLFRLNQFDASFIAADGVNVLATAMLLRVMGYVGGSLLMQEDVFLPGPDNGDYDFKTYAMSSCVRRWGVRPSGLRRLCLHDAEYVHAQSEPGAIRARQHHDGRYECSS